MSVFDHRPAPLAKRRSYSLAEGRLTCAKDGEVEWRLDLGLVEKAVLARHRVRRRQFLRLDLKGPEGWRSVSGNFIGSGIGDTDLRTHLALIGAVVDALPGGFMIGCGERGGWRHAWFGIGILALLSGAGILLGAILTGAETSRILVVALPMLVLSLFGYAVAMAHAPWRPVPMVRADALPGMLRSEGSGTGQLRVARSRGRRPGSRTRPWGREPRSRSAPRPAARRGHGASRCRRRRSRGPARSRAARPR